MRRKTVSFCVSTLILTISVLNADLVSERSERTEWFTDARFGLFVHWGLYAIPARGEWVRSTEKISLENYNNYFEEFNPDQYDPTSWAKLAKNAGMRYAVITAKHHDGFCLFDSKYTDYKVTNTTANRDLLREFVEAFRAEGLKIGFYYSLIDWHHPDYPPVGNHPLEGNNEAQSMEYDWENYLVYMHNQVKELLTEYGKIDILWFDYSFGEYSGEKWRASDLVRMVRQIQPHIIIDNRLGGNMESLNPEIFAGDFEGPEQIIPNRIVTDEKGNSIPWESCITLNNDWGYSHDQNYKTSAEVIRTLVNCVSKNGNLLLNVGPDARGRIPEKSVEVLEEVGSWMNRNSQSIYGCGASDFPKPEWGRYTQKGNTLYAHIFDRSIGQYYLSGMNGRVENARLLSDGSEAHLSDFWLGSNKPFVDETDLFLSLGLPLQFTHELPDKRDTVVVMKLKPEN